eukprot:GEMP01000973.1.p1 GENE.GEMP01000973.1~~GEMP01000973.1.p1  ORF type:complete len:1607 (+),score=348.82 GEMP01000973.1:74-4822(+)
MDTDDLGSTFSSFLKRISRMDEEDGGRPAGRFQGLLSELRSPDRTAQVVALTELSECLCISSEELLMSFPIDSFIPVLIRILDDPGEDDAAATRMVLCCRCIHSVIDILPQISGVVIAAGALPVLCSKLLNIEFIDVAELCVQILDLITEDQPLPVLKAGGFSAILTFLEFFPQSIQRQAACAAGKMLSAKTTTQQFDEFVRPVFPTLATLISNESGGQDPHVQQACCECWRRALDLVVIHYDKNSPHHNSAQNEKGGEKGHKMPHPKEIFNRGWQHGKRAIKETSVTTTELLAEILPESVFDNFLMMLSIKDNDQVLMEVLYIVSTVCALSDALCLAAMQHNIGQVLYDSLGKDISPTLVLSVVIAILPVVHLNDDGQFEVENKRLSMFLTNPDLLKSLIDTFLPKLLQMCHDLTEQSVRPLAVSTMLALVVAARSMPQVLISVDHCALSQFAASVLEFSDSKAKSEVLAAVTIVKELLEAKWEPYAELFVKHGVLQSLSKFVNPKRRNKQQKKRRRPSLTSVIQDFSSNVLNKYSTTPINMSNTVASLERVGRMLATPEKVAAAVRELYACMSKEVSGYQFVASKFPQALLQFFKEDPETRLALFLREMKIEKDNGVMFARLCRLCVDAVTSLEQLPLKIYQTSSNSGRLPLHLRPEAQKASPHDSHKGGGRKGSSGGAVYGSNSSLYLLKLMSKPFKARLQPKKGEDERQLDELAEELRSFENLAGLTFFSEASGRLNEESGGSVGSDVRPQGLRPLRFNPASPSSWSLGGSLGCDGKGKEGAASRLRNYFAQKMLRVKRMSDVGLKKEKAPSMPHPASGLGFGDSGKGAHAPSTSQRFDRDSARFDHDDQEEKKSVSGALSEFSNTSGRFDFALSEFSSRFDKEEGTGGALGHPAHEPSLGDKDDMDLGPCRPPEVSLLLVEPLATLSQLEEFVLHSDKRSPRNSAVSFEHVESSPSANKKVVMYSPLNPDVPLNMDQSLIQVLLNEEYTKSKATPANDDSEKGRFLVSDTHEGSIPKRLHCAQLWSKIHVFTYEVIAGDQSPVSDSKTSSMDTHAAMANTPYARLVTRVASIDRQFEPAKWRDAFGLGENGNAFLQALQLLKIVHHLSTYVSETVEGCVPWDFVSHQLSLKMSRQLSDPLAVATRTVPPWCMQLGTFNFLLSAATRNYLHHCCGLGVSRGLNFLQSRILSSYSPTPEMKKKLESEIQMGSIPRQKVRISRTRMLESAVKLMNLYGNKKPALEIEYQGEVGTGSGPTLEFYACVAEELKNDTRLFRENTPSGLLFPKPFLGGPDSASMLECFTLMGQLIAKAIVDNRLVDLHVHPVMWNLVRGVNVETPSMFHQEILHQVDPMLWDSLTKLLHMSDSELASLQMDFTLPGHPDISLHPDGEQMEVNKSNVQEYCFSVAKISLVDSVKQQVSAFREGFTGCLPLSAVSMWSDAELGALIVGCAGNEDEYWNFDSLVQHVKAMHGFKVDSESFVSLLRVMSRFTMKERRAFLSFCTGSPTLPKKGFSALRPPLVVVRKESPAGALTQDDFLPSVMTCANYLKLPAYSSEAVLESKLKRALEDGQGSFLLS